MSLGKKRLGQEPRSTSAAKTKIHHGAGTAPMQLPQELSRRTDAGDGWKTVSYAEPAGYMMRSFLCAPIA